MNDVSTIFPDHGKSKELNTICKVRTLFVYLRGRRERMLKWSAGLGPDEFMYGMTKLDSNRFQGAFIQVEDATPSRVKLISSPLERLVSMWTPAPFSVRVALGNLEVLKQADVVVTTVDNCGLPIAMLKTLGIIDTPLIHITQGLSDRLESLPEGLFRKRAVRSVYSRLLKSIEIVMTFGEPARDHLIEKFELNPEKVFYIPFGVDTDFWTPSSVSDFGDYILSVGSDSGRDYDTLLRAVTTEKTIIVTRIKLPQHKLKPCIQVGSHFSDVELRELFRNARFVVTPLKDVTQPTGQSATLQAMACGKAVILSRIRGLWEPDQLKHLENCYLVTPGDPDEIQGAMKFLYDHPEHAKRIGNNASEMVKANYSSVKFGRSLERYIDLLSRGPIQQAQIP